MSTTPPDYLFRLLPQQYRQLNEEPNYALQALMGILQSQQQLIEENLEDLYDDWFIETCADWVVPYIGQLLAVTGLNDTNSNIATQRTRVANTLDYRRRKGIGYTVSDAIRVSTRWYSRIAASVDLLGSDQNVKAVNLSRGRLVDVRNELALSELGKPFDRIAHRPAFNSQPQVYDGLPLSGKYNIPNVSIYVWRIPAYTLDYTVDSFKGIGKQTKFTFNPVDVDTPLLNRPVERGIGNSPSTRVDLPLLLTYSLLSANIEEFYGGHKSLFLSVGGEDVPSRDIAVMPLDWETVGWDFQLPNGKTVALDPERGRVQFVDPPENSLGIRYTYGFSAPIGGGPYDRRSTLAVPKSDTWTATVQGGGQALEDAIAKWNDLTPLPSSGIIEIVDNCLYDLPLEGQRVSLPSQGQLTIQASNGMRPAVSGNIIAKGWPTDLGDYSERSLVLNGLLMKTSITLEQNLGLKLLHTTLLPQLERASIAWISGGGDPEPPALSVSIDACILGRIRMPSTAESLTVLNSIIDGLKSLEPAIGPSSNDALAYGPPLVLNTATVAGKVRVREIRSAGDSIFTDLVTTERNQVGEVVYSYVPIGSDTPRRLRCQPDLALSELEASLNLAGTISREIVLARVRPVFTSVTYGMPGYYQLAVDGPSEIAVGAANGSEMGAFHLLNVAKLTANLNDAIAQSLPSGLAPGVFIVT